METIESLKIGDYQIVQDTEEYRFSSDSVLLARFLKAKKGERVADFCAGCGIVGLHFFAQNPTVSEVTLFEMQQKPAQLCKKSVELNHLEDKFNVENVKIQDIGAKFCEYFSLILCNPPYGDGGISSPFEKRALSKSELTLTIPELLDSVKRCLKFGGRFALIHRADRLAELICELRARNLEPKKLQFVSGTQNAKPYAVLLSAVKGARPGLDVLPTQVNKKENS